MSTLTNPLQYFPKLITNYRFADNIVENAEKKETADVLVDRLDTTTTSQVEGGGKQHKWLPQRDQDNWSEAIVSGELQVPGISHL